MPDEWTVARGHGLAEEVEAEIPGRLPSATVLSHLEPLADPVAWDDVDLDRPAAEAEAPDWSGGVAPA